MEPFRAIYQCPMVADFHHFYDEQDPDSQSVGYDPGPHQIDKRDPDMHQDDADPSYSIGLKYCTGISPV
jgi:hypothetical protein